MRSVKSPKLIKPKRKRQTQFSGRDKRRIKYENLTVTGKLQENKELERTLNGLAHVTRRTMFYWKSQALDKMENLI